MSDFRETIADITKNVTKTSGDFFKTAKFNMNLSTEESNLKNLYLEIGRKVHEIYQYGGSLGKFFDAKYLELEACERKIANLKEQIDLIKGTRQCVKCGKTAERTSEFCPKCGTRMEMTATPHSQFVPPEIPAPAIPPPPPATPAPSKICRVCSAENEPTTKFCLSCGRAYC